MQHSDEASQYETCDDNREELTEVLDRTILHYDRLIQQQTILRDQLRGTRNRESNKPAADFVIRRAA